MPRIWAAGPAERFSNGAVWPFAGTSPDGRGPVRTGVPAHARWVTADDGAFIYCRHVPPAHGASGDMAFVVVHGFTQSGARPGVRRVARSFRRRGGVITIDMRGHGRSAGHSTLGHQEVRDVSAAVGWARVLGYRRVVTVGFSMGGAVVLRHAALAGGVDAVAAVSSPGQWFYRGSPSMRMLHHLVLTRGGRAALRVARGVRVSSAPWPEPYPIDPREASAQVRVPLLVVHGRHDHYFPAHHGWGIHAANDNSEFWLEDDFGHAEGAVTSELAGRIADWHIRQMAVIGGERSDGTSAASLLGGAEGGGRGTRIDDRG